MTAFAIVTMFGVGLIGLLLYAAYRNNFATNAEQRMSNAVIICIIGAGLIITSILWWIMFIRLAIS